MGQVILAANQVTASQLRTTYSLILTTPTGHTYLEDVTGLSNAVLVVHAEQFFHILEDEWPYDGDGLAFLWTHVHTETALRHTDLVLVLHCTYHCELCKHFSTKPTVVSEAIFVIFSGDVLLAVTLLMPDL